MNSSFSYESIYRKYRTSVLSYISARIPSYAEAEDLCEEVFVKLLHLLENYDENKASVSTLIYKLSHDIVIDFYRTHKEYAELSEELAVLPSAEEIVMDKEKLTELAGALQKLPQQQRDILILRFYQGWTLGKIANKMGLTYHMTVSRQNKALESLRKMLKDKI